MNVTLYEGNNCKLSENFESFLQSSLNESGLILGLFHSETFLDRAMEFLIPALSENYLPVLIMDSVSEDTLRKKILSILQDTGINDDSIMIINPSFWFESFLHYTTIKYSDRWAGLISKAKSLHKSGIRIFIDKGFVVEENISHSTLKKTVDLVSDFPIIKLSAFTYDNFIKMRPVQFKILRNRHPLFYAEKKFFSLTNNALDDVWNLIDNPALSKILLATFGDCDKERILKLLFTKQKSIFQISKETNIPRTSCYRKSYELLQDGLIYESGQTFESGTPVSLYRSIISEFKLEISSNCNNVYVKWN